MGCRDSKTHLTGFENQFKACHSFSNFILFFGLQVLEKVSPNPIEILRKRALENSTRNRSDDYLPGIIIHTYIC